ncbi:MAG: hypothetical protein QMD92_08555, partial [bacterium]|nr:hypothetical protein [bacterium]
YTIKSLLGIEKYKVTKIISRDEVEIHIQVEPYKRSGCHCPNCKEIHKKGKHSSQTVVAEDKRLGDLRVYLHVVKRKCYCPKDGRIYNEEISWLNKWSRFTTRFSKEVNRLTAITTNQEAGWFLGLNDEVIYCMDKEILENLFEERLIPTPASLNISVDEVAWKKRHRYLTNVIDTDEKVVIWNAIAPINHNLT